MVVATGSRGSEERNPSLLEVRLYAQNVAGMLYGERISLMYEGHVGELQYRCGGCGHDRRYGTFRKRWTHLSINEFLFVIEPPSDIRDGRMEVALVWVRGFQTVLDAMLLSVRW